MRKPVSLDVLPEKPLVSILVASYNYEAYIEEAVGSALKQTYEHIEIIVCDDGSTDDSCAIVKRLALADDRIQLLEQKNAGVAAALNNAFQRCKGAIVCLLDADDTFHPDKVRLVVDKMQWQGLTGFVQHAMDVVDGDHNIIKQLPVHGLFEEGWIADKLEQRGGRWRNMPASALSFRREIAAMMFPLPASDLRSMADAYLYMMAPMLTKVGYLSRPLSAYRLHGANLTGALHFDASLSRKYTEGIERVHACINLVANQRQLPMPALESDRHLTYVEHRFMQQLFEGANKRDLKEMYRQVSSRIQKDDLYPAARKRFGLLVFGAALYMPVKLRSKWISWTIGRG